MPCIAKVLGYDKLKREFKQYKDKRSLLKEYDLFLADLRVYKMLPECLGKEFYAHKKFPCPIKVHGFAGKELEAQLNKSVATTTFMMGNGPNYSIRVGKTFQDAKDVAENVLASLKHAIAVMGVHDDIEFAHVCQATLRCGDSPELPFYNFLTKEDLEACM